MTDHARTSEHRDTRPSGTVETASFEAPTDAIGAYRPPLAVSGLAHPAIQRSATRAASTEDVDQARVQTLRRMAERNAEAQAERSATEVLRAPGRPMADGIRREMETRFGADFSTVRVHEGSAASGSAAALGARAYTAGESIVLGGGGADKHTLAHELTHVLQQRAGDVSGTAFGSRSKLSDPADACEQQAEATASRVLAAPLPATAPGDHQHSTSDSPSAATGGAAIQRKVGFEFETNMPVAADGKALIAKNAHIFDSFDDDWYITPDSGTLEFVTKAFEEEGEAHELEEMIKTVTGAAQAFEFLHLAVKLAGGEKPVPLAEGLELFGEEKMIGGKPAYVPHDLRLYPPTAVPQATGGVSLAKITAMFDALVAQKFPLTSPANPGEMAVLGEEREERGDSWAVAAATERAMMAKARLLATAYCAEHPNPKLEGLLTLTFTYLLAGAGQTKQHDQAKYFLPIMSRMSFSSMYASLDEDSKAAFDPARILAAAEMTETAQEHLYKHGFKDGAETVDRGPTRAGWLASIASGAIDTMSAGGASMVAQGKRASSSAMGQYNALDDGVNAEAAKLARIELRRLPREVPPEEWPLLAEAIFKMFRAVQS